MDVQHPLRTSCVSVVYPNLCRASSILDEGFFVRQQKNQSGYSIPMPIYTWTFRGSKVLGVGQKARIFRRWRENMFFLGESSQA